MGRVLHRSAVAVPLLRHAAVLAARLLLSWRRRGRRLALRRVAFRRHVYHRVLERHDMRNRVVVLRIEVRIWVVTAAAHKRALWVGRGGFERRRHGRQFMAIQLGGVLEALLADALQVFLGNRRQFFGVFFGRQRLALWRWAAVIAGRGRFSLRLVRLSGYFRLVGRRIRRELGGKISA